MAYVFDKSSFRFLKATRSIGKVLLSALRYFAYSVTVAVLLYGLFCIFFSTDSERRLRRDNIRYAQQYKDLSDRQEVVEDVVRLLEIRDAEIYGEIFHTSAPSMRDVLGLEEPANPDTIPYVRLVKYSALKAEALEETGARVEDNFRRVEAALAKGKESLPPLTMPLEDFSYVRTGASVGEKLNPFLNVPSAHQGIDLLSPQGDPVLASADGVVSVVVHSTKGQGNTVTINHGNGYETRYCHLSSIGVSQGQRVRRGARIGTVGITGNAYVPHLHYEVLKDGLPQDPLNYFFASLGPREYTQMLFLSSSTGQSMD